MVITQPVTTGGKKRIIFEKNGASNKPINDATMTAPNAEANPPPVVTIAKIVATPAKDPPLNNRQFCTEMLKAQCL